MNFKTGSTVDGLPLLNSQQIQNIISNFLTVGVNFKGITTFLNSLEIIVNTDKQFSIYKDEVTPTLILNTVQTNSTSETLRLYGSQTIDYNLLVKGIVTINGNTTIDGYTTIKNTLEVVNSQTKLGGTLNVSGNTTINGQTIINNTLTVTQNITTNKQIISTVPSGTPPLIVSSNTKVTNLNQDLLDGYEGSFYRNQSNLNQGTVPTQRLSGTYNINISGNQQTQSKLQTQRTITISGSVNGSQNFDGSNNITITTTTNHTHDDRYYTESEMNSKLNNYYTKTNLQTSGQQSIHWNNITNKPSTYPPSSHTHVISQITDIGNQSVNYQTSQGNQDKLDGYHQSSFQLQNHNHDSTYVKISGSTMSGTLTVPLLRIDNSYTTLDKGQNNQLRIQTNYGYIDIGPQNTGQAHIYTDRPWFYFNKDIKGQGKVWGQVYNDYQEFRLQEEKIEQGYVVITTKNGKVKKCNKDRQKNIQGIVSDVFGFQIGNIENEVTVPIQVQGRVLVYQVNKENLKIGDQVCQTKDGKVRKMKWWEKILFPEQIVGFVDEIPTYEEWGQDKVKVNGRIWIRVR